MARTINLHLDDSTAEILGFIRSKIERYKEYIDEMLNDYEGNQLMINLYMHKLRTLEEVFIHLKYN